MKKLVLDVHEVFTDNAHYNRRKNLTLISNITREL